MLASSIDLNDSSAALCIRHRDISHFDANKTFSAKSTRLSKFLGRKGMHEMVERVCSAVEESFGGGWGAVFVVTLQNDEHLSLREERLPVYV